MVPVPSREVHPGLRPAEHRGGDCFKTRGCATVPSMLRPFPWASLDATSRADLAALSELRRWSARVVNVDRAAAALAEIAGGRVAISLRSAQRGGRVRNLDEGVGVVLARADRLEHDPGVLVEAEGPLAATLVARALKRPAPRVTTLSHQASPNLAGAFGAVLVAAARTGHAGSSLRILAAGPAPTLALELDRATRDFDIATFTVTVDHDAYLARVTLPRGAVIARTGGSGVFGRSELATLGRATIDVPLVASWSFAPLAEVGALAPGDAWMPGRWPLERTPGGKPAGPVLLAAPGLDYGLRAVLGEDGRLVLRDGVEAMSQEIDSPDRQDPLAETVGEVPVVVRVEIGTARMRAREWAELKPGDVVALGRRIGEPVTLRVEGAELARGELVEIEGEVGVRILARTVDVPEVDGGKQ